VDISEAEMQVKAVILTEPKEAAKVVKPLAPVRIAVLGSEA
jgi:hypothetical protein